MTDPLKEAPDTSQYQPHTYLGERGNTKVENVTYHQVYMSMVVGFYRAAGVDIQGWSQDELCQGVYHLDWDHIDPIAAVQNACIRIEQHQGIYPNVPGRTL